MDGNSIQDRIHWGLNAAARAIGTATDVYRPSGVVHPLAAVNRTIRMQAAFSAPDGKFSQPSGYGAALWHGVFDGAYTGVGDYLVQGDLVWFIAAQQALLPILCVRTNRIVSFSRASAPASTGVNNYGGVTASTATPLLVEWPASVLGTSAGARPEAGLPGDSTVPYWTVLLPAWPGVTLLPADLMIDDLGRNAAVAAAELSGLGWRLTVKQAIT